jgi:tRNA 2-selenouridine synthase
MRSGFVARLFELLGYSVPTLQGGYKAFRRWTLQRLQHFDFPHLCVLSGLTGSGKTFILQALQQKGEQVIDLESLAHHRGSTFGGIGMAPQPSQEQFENELAQILEHLDPSKRVWIEDESRLIGHCHLPTALYQSLAQTPLFYIHRSLDERLATLVAQYGQAPKDQLLEAVNRIAKRLGSQLTKEVKQLIEHEQNVKAFERLLAYYDKTYQHQIAKRSIKYCIKQPPFSSPDEWASACLCTSQFYRQSCKDSGRQ